MTTHKVFNTNYKVPQIAAPFEYMCITTKNFVLLTYLRKVPLLVMKLKHSKKVQKHFYSAAFKKMSLASREIRGHLLSYFKPAKAAIYT